jgi:hypothetical protein
MPNRRVADRVADRYLDLRPARDALQASIQAAGMPAR